MLTFKQFLAEEAIRVASPQRSMTDPNKEVSVVVNPSASGVQALTRAYDNIRVLVTSKDVFVWDYAVQEHGEVIQGMKLDPKSVVPIIYGADSGYELYVNPYEMRRSGKAWTPNKVEKFLAGNPNIKKGFPDIELNTELFNT